ncbi:MAG: glycosyl hydrolase [Chloroflexota bacterium]
MRQYNRVNRKGFGRIGLTFVISGMVLLIILLLIDHSQLLAQPCGEEKPFLGVGLGYNQYAVEDLYGLAGGDPCQLPLVYNWALGESAQSPGNMPHLDFPHRFVPMVYGCTSTRFIEEIPIRRYSGPVLLFNEPDRTDQANCTPEKAAAVLNDLHRFRQNYERETGLTLTYIVGGVGDPTDGLAWLEEMIASYQQQFGVDLFETNVAEGIHFHLYPRYAYDNGQGAFANIQEQMEVWRKWLEQHDLRAWVTELGVLNVPEQSMPAYEFADFLRKSIAFLAEQKRIEHAFVFTLNAEPGTDSARFVRTALQIDGQKMPAYEVAREACIVQGHCLVLQPESPASNSSMSNPSGTNPSGSNSSELDPSTTHPALSDQVSPRVAMIEKFHIKPAFLPSDHDQPIHPYSRLMLEYAQSCSFDYDAEHIFGAVIDGQPR